MKRTLGILATVAAIAIWIWNTQSHLLVLGAVISVVLLAGIIRFAMWAFLPQRELSSNRVRYVKVRLACRVHPGKGFATLFALAARYGRWPMFRQSSRIRPDLSLWQRRHPDEYSTLVGTAHLGRKVRVSHQQVIACISPPRTGKSAWLARTILHHPGSVVSTSSQVDIYRWCYKLRAQLGEVKVLNPAGLGDIPSNFHWDLVAGCSDAATAIRRADALINAAPKGGTDGGDFFAARASDVLRAYLCAGDLAGYDFRRVSQWLLSNHTTEPIAFLEQHNRQQLAATLREQSGPAAKTAASVTMFASKSIQFATDPALLEAVMPADDELDLVKLLTKRQSLFAIAPVSGDDSPLAGLFAALLSEIRHVAMEIAADNPNGRVTPSVLFALDEVARTAPVPAAAWAADGGGRGQHLVLAAQGVQQLEARYGHSGAQSILDCATVKITYGGVSDPNTLSMLETLAGTVAIREREADSHARHPVIPAGVIRELPDRVALLISGNSPACLIRPPMVWKDRLYRRSRRMPDVVPSAVPSPKILAKAEAES